MKIIYVDLNTFRISMMRDPENERQVRVETIMFDLCSDNEIENDWLYIPSGHRYIDPTTGYAYTGEATVPLNNGERYVVRETREVMNEIRTENNRIKAENEDLKIEIMQLKAQVETLTARFVRLDERITSVEKIPNEEILSGDFLNPIRYEDGMEVIQGLFYYNGDKELAAEAKQSGVPDGWNTEWFDII